MPAVAPEQRQCFKCGFDAVIGQTVCPRCGKRLFTAQNIRMRGIALVLIGLFLVVFMGAIAIFVGTLLAGAANDPAAAKKMKQDPFAFLAVIAIFASVIAFGINSIAGGIWMVVFGKRNKFFIWIMWAALFLLFAFGAIFRFVT